MSIAAGRRERGSGLGEGNLWAWLAARMLRWGHPRSPLRRTVILIGLVALWAVLSMIGWNAWEPGEGRIQAGPASDLPYLALWLLTPQGDVWGEMPLALNLGRFVGAAIPLLGIIFLAARQIGDALAESLMQLAGSDHLVVIGEGRDAAVAAETARGEGAAVVLIDPTVTEPQAEDLNQLGVLVIRDDLRAATRKSALGRARRVVVVGPNAGSNLSLADRAAAVMDADTSDLHVQVEDEDVLEKLRQSAAAHAGPGPAPRPFSLATAAARQANEALRLWDRPGGLHVAMLDAGPFSQAMAREALVLGWRVGRAPPRVTFWDPEGEIEDRWRRMAPGALGDLSRVYDSPPFRIVFSRAASIGAYLEETSDADGWVVESDVGVACAASLLASRLDEGPVVIVAGEQPLGGALVGVHTAVSGFASGLEPVILPAADRQAQRLHGAYENRGRDGYIELGSDASGVRWSILPESLWSANRAAAAHIPVKLADAEAAGADPRDDRDLLERMAELEHERWCAERLLNGWRPGERDNRLKLHPGLAGWQYLDEPTRQKDRDGVIDAFRVARPRDNSRL